MKNELNLSKRGKSVHLSIIIISAFQGTLQLWNLKSGKKIYTFKGWKSPVTCIVPCPQVLDAVAIGLESGDIIGKLANTVFPHIVSSLEQFPHIYILYPKVTVHKAKLKKEQFPRKLYEEIRYSPDNAIYTSCKVLNRKTCYYTENQDFWSAKN